MSTHNLTISNTTKTIIKYISSTTTFNFYYFHIFFRSHQLFFSQPQNINNGTKAAFDRLLGVDNFFNYLKKIPTTSFYILPKYCFNLWPLPIKHYDFWNVKTKTFFFSQTLWDIIKEWFTILKNTTQKKKLKENKQKDSMALFSLQQVVNDTIFPKILGVTSAKQT